MIRFNDYDYSYSFSIRFRTSLGGEHFRSRLLATVAAGTRDRKLAQLGPKRALVDTTFTGADTDALSGRLLDQAYRWSRWPGRRCHRRARLDRVESERKSAHLMDWYDNLS